MPYAYGATIKHEFETDHLNIWLTFRHPMDQDLKPPLALWLLEADDVSVDIIDSAWQDEFTFLLTSDTIIVYPDRVLLEYNGPNSNLQTTWGKDWEPWGPSLSADIKAQLAMPGMIILWSGAVVDIPSGWQLCNGTNGTPDLRDRFLVGAGSAYAPDDTGGNALHNHYFEFVGSGTLSSGLIVLTDPPNGQLSNAFAFAGGGTTDNSDGRPPYYALCFIMKL